MIQNLGSTHIAYIDVKYLLVRMKRGIHLCEYFVYDFLYIKNYTYIIIHIKTTNVFRIRGKIRGFPLFINNRN